jgi:Domain of unknown function (DUF4386)
MINITRTARTTGAWYLALAMTAALGFVVLRARIVDDHSPATTLQHLQDNASTAHLMVLFEMAIVVTQALAAVWFYKLLRPFAPTAGFAVATFGLMNSAAIMASGAFMATAEMVASNADLAPGSDQAGTVGLLFAMSSSAWGMGRLFFGLWLIPMGWVAFSTRRFPLVLGWILVAGGICYLVSGLVGYGIPGAPVWLVQSLAFPATVGELWMIGYLLIIGIRRNDHPELIPPFASPAQVSVSPAAPSYPA